MRKLAILVMILFVHFSLPAQTTLFKSKMFPVTLNLSADWEASDNEDYKKIIVNHKTWGPVYIEKSETGGATIDQVYKYVKQYNFLDSTGKVKSNLDFKEGLSTINGRQAMYMIGISKDGSMLNGAWTYLHYFIKKANTDFYYFRAEIRADAIELFKTAIGSFVIL